MSRGTKRKTRGISQENAKDDVFPPKEADSASKLETCEAMEAMEANILAKLKEVQTELKKEITDKTGLMISLRT